MSDKPISDLRRGMIADMTVRSFSDKTLHDGRDPTPIIDPRRNQPRIDARRQVIWFRSTRAYTGCSWKARQASCTTRPLRRCI